MSRQQRRAADVGAMSGRCKDGVASPSVTSLFFFCCCVGFDSEISIFVFSLSLFKRRSLRGLSVILGLDEAQESSWSEFTSAPQW